MRGVIPIPLPRTQLKWTVPKEGTTPNEPMLAWTSFSCGTFTSARRRAISIARTARRQRRLLLAHRLPGRGGHPRLLKITHEPTAGIGGSSGKTVLGFFGR